MSVLAQAIVDNMLEGRRRNPDDIDPLRELSHVQPSLEHWLKSVGFHTQPGTPNWMFMLFENATVWVHPQISGQYDILVNFDGGSNHRFYEQSDDEVELKIKGWLRNDYVDFGNFVESEDPDAINPNDELGRVEPRVDHWLRSNGFTTQYNDGWFHKEVNGVHFNVRWPLWADEEEPACGDWTLSTSIHGMKPEYIPAEVLKRRLAELGAL